MKNKRYFFSEPHICSFYRCLFSALLALFFVSNNTFGSLPKCTADINEVDTSLIQLVTTDNNTNKLFLIVKKDEFDKGSMCYTAANSHVECDTTRIEGESSCTNKIACSNGYSITCSGGTCKCKNGNIETDFTTNGDCDDFNNYVSSELKDTKLEKACYPKNHICLEYKNYYKNNQRLYKKEIQNNGDKFYVYKKNMINSGTNKNCEFYVFSCDYSIRNESMPNSNVAQNQINNLVVSGTNNNNNKIFVENIFGSLGDMSFFVQAGECDITNGTCTGNCTRDSGDNKCSTNMVLEKRYYYKYYDTSKKILYYYEKNIATGKENNVGNICDKYLPSCVDLRPNDSMVVLYQNRSSGAVSSRNNVEARKNFYRDNVSNNFLINEANLYYLSSSGAADALCLSKEGTDDIDVGYCSDTDMNGNLKYRDGLTLTYFSNDNTAKPNCYLKSCIDLTTEEFEVIKREGKIDKKYCSEYYWLSNTRGLKYFPKEKPVYCSDIENGHLKFSSYQVAKIIDNTSPSQGEQINDKIIEYYAGGGLDREKGNCYLKNCYSLTKNERKLVADTKVNNIALEIERACTEGTNCNYKENFKSSNIPVYCDNGFLFNKDTPGYTNFDPINLNVIPCYEFRVEQLNNIGAERVLLFTKLIGKDGKHSMGDKRYETDTSTIFCRTHYVPLNSINSANDNSEKGSFLGTRVILANEKDKIKDTPYYNNLEKWGITKYEDETPENFDIKYSHDDMGYQKVPFKSRKLYEFKNEEDINIIYYYTNILSYVDNVFPYYNADLPTMKSADVFNGNELINYKITIVKQKNPDFFNCLNDSDRANSKQEQDDDLAKDEKCSDCIGGNGEISQEKCLYSRNDCKKYVPLEYECKYEFCDDKDDITRNYCYIEDFAKEKMSNADFYIAKNENTAYLDCSLYAYAAAGSEEYKIFTTSIISDFLEEVGKDKLNIIKTACDDLLPIVDDRELPEASILQQLLKPNKVDINFANGSGSPGKHDLERYGCTQFRKVDTDNYGLYGCKLPDVASSYFNTTLDPVKLYNNSKKPTEIKVNDLSICSRYQNDIFDENGKCGQREGSQYNDKCLDFSLDVSDRGLNVLDSSPQKSKWIFEESTGGSRFRAFRENRDIYAIRDFHTYHYCSATENFEGKDDEGAAYVYAAGFTAGAAIGLVACPIGCIPGCMAALFATGVCVGICIPVCTVSTAAITGGIYLGVRYNQWNLSLQNDLHIVRGYNLNDYRNKGFITKALVTDNDNYIYRFYPRSDDIEEDLSNKLNSNSEYFRENTFGVDILKKCGISVTPENSENPLDFGLVELTKSNHDNNAGDDFSYKVKKFDNDSEIANGYCNESNVKDCLNDKQKKCIEGYGVSFFDGEFLKEVDSNFALSDGGFLKRYHMGDIAKDDWGSLASPSNKNRDWLPVDIVYNTLNTQDENNANCKMGLFGDPIGDLSRCRGFSLDCKNNSDKNVCDKLGSDFNGIQTFFTESQALKLPLAGHPFFFYTLLTPKNTPEMFDPSIFVEKFCSYKTKVSECEQNMVPNDGLNELVLNFFEPILKISYEYNGGVANDDFKNHYAAYNNFISYINSLANNSSDNYSYSCPYQLKYKSNNIKTERKYVYVLHRTFEQGVHNEYVPKVCLYKITGSNSSVNTIYNFYVDNKCPNKNGVLKENGYIIIDNNVMCFPRAPLNFDNLVLAESPDINYNRPYINSKIIDNDRRISYKLRQNDSDYNIMDFAENRDLGFGLNFTRSYCSKLYYDYYKYVDQLERGGDTLDQATINRINKSINSIESYIRNDCDKENGYESEFLINESSMKSKIDDENKNIPDSEVVFKETAIVRKNNSVYGGFNELCVSDYDIENIFSINKDYAISDGLTSFPEVFAFADDNTDGIETKCLLDGSSRKNISCMNTDRFVYLYLNDAEQEKYLANCENGKCKVGVNNCNDEQCRLYVNVDSLERIPLRKYECVLEDGRVNPELLTDVSDMDDDIIRKISACYKGGFNYAGIVRDSIDSSDVKAQCRCQTVINTNNQFLKIRNMTPREYGLCIDLKKPIICPAVRYYDSSKTYVDDNLALGKTKEEMDKNDQQKYYEQHLWRTAEKIAGIIPSVFYSNTLGHAEFPASIYCENEEDCLGGFKNVTGICLGYWKNGVSTPTATCEVKNYNGKNVYEYKIESGTECVRYECHKIGDNNLDEYDISNNTSNVFTTTEILNFNNIKRTDYRSFINNEEVDITSVDKRGLSNGFAAWKELESGDFAKDRYEIEGDIFINCLTGYGLAGSNYRISDTLLVLDENIRNKIKGYYKIDEKYFNNNLVDNIDRRLIYNSIYDKVIIMTQNSYTRDKPKRYCNQKGEWMPVEDVYNKMVLDSDSLENNLYHSGVIDLWLSIFNNERNYNVLGSLDDSASLIDKVSQYGYCERLVCKGIEQLDENYYIDEFFNEGTTNSKTKDIYKFWLHSGGANWEVTSAPRNSLNKITNDENADPNSSEFSSRSLKNILSYIRYDEFDDYVISNEYKYLKKVKGECRKEIGYYNRGTSFLLTSVGSQVADVIKYSKNNEGDEARCPLEKELCKERCRKLGVDADDCNERCSDANLSSENCVDSRKVTDFAIDGNNEPYRICTNVGVWGEVNNKCVRSCEMLHLYRTNMNGNLYSSDRPSNIYNENLKIENHDIVSFNSDVNIRSKYMEGRFLTYDFRNPNLKNQSNYTQGDSIFGGADWPRSIVDVDTTNQYDCDSNGKCLRYVLVEGECNKDYNTRDVTNPNPTQYNNSTTDSSGRSKGPTRKCYEDGTWGPIQNKCFLEKSCVTLSLLASDVAELIKKYNNSSTKLDDLNNTLSDIYAEHLKEEIGDSANGLLKISAGNGLVGFPISCNNVEDKTGGGFRSVESNAYPGYCRTAGCCGNGVSMVCNSSDKLDGGTKHYIAGWSFNTLELERYFIPNTCSITLKRDIEGDNIYFKIKDGAGNIFACDNSSDLSGKIDRLNFAFASKINNYPINSYASHYVKESKFDLVYNYINNVTNINYNVKKTNNSNNNVGIPSLYDKTININGSIGTRGGSNKTYYSHQIYATCDNRYFYNEVSGNDYYNKLAIFSCQRENSGFRFKPEYTDSNNGYLLKSENSLADACKPKTCGNEGKNNIYQNGWSESYVKEFVDSIETKEYNNDFKLDSNSKFSQLSCSDPTKYAFVIKNTNELNTDTNVGSYFSPDGEVYGLVSSLKSTCSASRSESAYTSTNEPQEVWNDSNKSSFKIINGKAASNAYDANRYGDLQYKDLPKTFCKDIAKVNCKELSEEEQEVVMMKNGNTFSKTVDEDKENGYCVRMGCPRLNLRVVNTDSGLKVSNGGEAIGSIPNTFTLPKKNDNSDEYYDFGDVVVIQSLEGDYSSGDCPTSICGGDSSIKKFVQYNNASGSQIVGNLCGSNQDIYNEGAGEYNYNTYVEANNNDESDNDKLINIISCFNNLSSKDSISKTNVSGYEKINNSLYVKYNDSYKSELKILDNVKSLTNYIVSKDNQDIKNKANDLFKKYSFDKISITDNSEIKNDVSVSLGSIRSFVDKQIEDIEKYALEEAQKLYNSTDSNISYLCLYNDGVVSLNTGEGIKFTGEGHGLFKCNVDSCKDKEVIFVKNGDDKCKKTTTNSDNTQETVLGSYYLKVSDFEDKFKTTAQNKLNDLKNNFKASDSNDTTVKELYNGYYDFYFAEKYFKEEKNACRIKYYNDYLSGIVGAVGQICVIDNNGKVIADFEDCNSYSISDDTNISFTFAIDENGNSAILNYEKYGDTNGMICKKYSVDNNGNETIANCDNSISISEEAASEYEKYYLNIFEEQKPKINSEYEKYQEEYQNEESKCAGIYEEYLTNKSNNDSSIVGKIKSGLFMIMKCTPNGWIVEGKPSCKKRCNGHADFRIDPDGAGDFDIRIIISNLRHSKNTGIIEVGAHRGLANCSVTLSYVYGRNGASFSCDNGEMKNKFLHNGGGILSSGYKYHSSGLAWHIYCTGTFSAFGITTQRNADVGGFFHTVSCSYDDSFCWRDHYENDVAILCPNSTVVHKLVHSCDLLNNCIDDYKCNTKFDTITTVDYEANFH